MPNIKQQHLDDVGKIGPSDKEFERLAIAQGEDVAVTKLAKKYGLSYKQMVDWISNELNYSLERSVTKKAGYVKGVPATFNRSDLGAEDVFPYGHEDDDFEDEEEFEEPEEQGKLFDEKVISTFYLNLKEGDSQTESALKTAASLKIDTDKVFYILGKHGTNKLNEDFKAFKKFGRLSEDSEYIRKQGLDNIAELSKEDVIKALRTYSLKTGLEDQYVMNHGKTINWDDFYEQLLDLLGKQVLSPSDLDEAEVALESFANSRTIK